MPRALFASETVAVSGPPVEGNWRLVFEDAFDADTLDALKWIPSYYECDWIKVYQKN